MAGENNQEQLPQNSIEIIQITIDQDQEQHKPRWLGTRCPKCNQGYLDYDGLLNRFCPKCGYHEGGCFT